METALFPSLNYLMAVVVCYLIDKILFWLSSAMTWTEAYACVQNYYGIFFLCVKIVCF